jgi:hypothetical protein
MTTANAEIAPDSPFGYLYGSCMVDYVVSAAPGMRTLCGVVGASLLAIALHP